ncbi:hypothetical protein SBA_ch1_31330 [Sphingomonas bisphenolicum]|uniref:Uncharacterized protein n=1 Tax=Sphingomonas bisphenolicum TaxID=296544 RepID=A0ABM7G671_9SPHN|nr:hypothetical protein SBA_ch1_31330 [Sphingomonas bisphenolicum]
MTAVLTTVSVRAVQHFGNADAMLERRVSHGWTFLLAMRGRTMRERLALLAAPLRRASIASAAEPARSPATRLTRVTRIQSSQQASARTAANRGRMFGPVMGLSIRVGTSEP